MVSVLPSGAARATAAAETVPPAPSRLSTTIGWPSRLLSPSATMRAVMSMLAPGVKPCISVIGRPCEIAGAGNAAAADKPARAVRRVIGLVIIVSPIFDVVIPGRAQREPG